MLGTQGTLSEESFVGCNGCAQSTVNTGKRSENAPLPCFGGSCTTYNCAYETASSYVMRTTWITTGSCRRLIVALLEAGRSRFLDTRQ